MSKSFFERITGTVSLGGDEFVEDDNGVYDDTYPSSKKRDPDPYDIEDYDDDANAATAAALEQRSYESDLDEVGELPVDVYHTDNAIFVKAMTAGVRKSDLDIVVNRDQVQISGSRAEKNSMPPENYQHRELYWGSFTRLIDLPFEVDIEQASATEEAGLLTLKLPKLNKERTTRLRVE